MNKTMAGVPRRHITILVGIPIFKPDDRFLESLPKFTQECVKDYTMQVITIPGRTLVDAQNYIAKYFLQQTEYDYLLLMEDDHWGFTKEMLEALISKDVEVCAMNYYSRHFPYINCLMHVLPGRTGCDRYAGLQYTQGFYKCDLAGFAMMLIKRSVFSKLSAPYFRLNKDSTDGAYATDIDFSDRLHEAGIDIWGCFDYIVPHRDITKENRLAKFLEGLTKHRKDEVDNVLLKRNCNANQKGATNAVVHQ